MIDLYTWSTPNGRKVSIMLEELGLAYTVFPIDITKGEQFAPEFLAISPNNKIPAIVDHDAPDGEALRLFESGAILIYLAERHGRFLPEDLRPRLEVMQWLMFQMGNVGPLFGQAHHFRRSAKQKIPYAIERYTNETRRLYGVMDKRLAEREHLAGGDYSIADIATFPWVARHQWHGVELSEFANVKRWYDNLWRRPAVKRGYGVP
jgi:GST-like protein